MPDNSVDNVKGELITDTDLDYCIQLWEGLQAYGSKYSQTNEGHSREWWIPF